MRHTLNKETKHQYMNKINLLIFILVFAVKISFAQTVLDSISITWTKYIILNDKNEVLLRYDNYYKAWELTGCGYDGPISFKNLMDTLADYLGIRYDTYRLGGVFTYTKPGRYRATVKPYFVVHFIGYTNGKCFSDSINTKWVSIEEANKMIPYPTMVMILNQLTKYPDTIWGGAFEEYNYIPPTATKWKIIEAFYKLN